MQNATIASDIRVAVTIIYFGLQQNFSRTNTPVTMSGVRSHMLTLAATGAATLGVFYWWKKRSERQ